jgi:hypothetical protein
VSRRASILTNVARKKNCTKCGVAKPLQEFHRNRRERDGRHHHCKECKGAYQRTYYAKNIETQRARTGLWRIANPEYARQQVDRRQARKVGAVGRHTRREWSALCDRYGNKCLRCGATDRPLTRDHVIPLYLGGTDYTENLQPLCGPCNSMKGLRVADYREGLIVHSDQRGESERVSIQEAARRLGITESAVRKRVERGSLRHDKEGDGRVYVYLDMRDMERDRVQDISYDMMVTRLENENEFLRRELERKDAILLNMTEAMKALSPPERESPQTVEEASEGAEPRPGTEESQEAVQRPWWRRWLGG